jgi:uncharacterized membrane protein
MMLLDVVIDPLAVRGDRGFLGRIFYYPDGRLLFGVPLSSFAGWMLAGWTAIGGYLLLAGRRETGSPAAGATLYYLVLGFNLIIGWWIREPSRFLLGALLHVSRFVLWSCYALGGGQAGRGVFSSSSRTAFDSDQACMGGTVHHRLCSFERRLRRRNPVLGEASGEAVEAPPE